MERFYIAAINTKSGAFMPLESLGILSNQENALNILRNDPSVTEYPKGVFHSNGPEEMLYIILPLTKGVCDNWFFPREYTVIFVDIDGYYVIGAVKSIIDLADIKPGDGVFESLCEQLGATDIIDIRHAEDLRIKEIKFNAVR